ncbi:ATPase AAA [Paenibacillus swuensis]|uniref:ATPase AAA n=1 Tax=Paenibacillus swuensis TaxID=1178515 RepID=A0A172TH26_9BACL|nr:primosomal protein DnaI [Paenibacillus swuensis]ANE46167.1 ATPase AAA [Paenibacillus swuensis]
MESLSDLLKDPSNRNLLRQAEMNSLGVMSDPAVIKFRAKHPELDEKTLKLNMNRLYQYAQEYNHCTHCPGLDQCPNDMQGHYTKLSVEGVNGSQYVNDHKVPCKKLTAREAELKIRKRIRCMYIDEKVLEEGFSAKEILTMDAKRAESAHRVLSYVEKTKLKGLQSQGLYLAGNFGTGKTYLMSYLLNELAKEGFTGAIVFMPDFVEDIKRMFQDDKKMFETIELLKETDLLILDDLGSENLNAWFRDHVLASILNYRMGRKPTFYTSNHDFEWLQKHLSYTKDGNEENKGARLMERIKPYVEYIKLEGENKRFRNK